MLVIHSMENKICKLDSVKSMKEMEIFIEKFRVLASNHRNNETIIEMIDAAILKCKRLNDQKSLVKLYEIKISQIEHLNKNISLVLDLVDKMKEIAEKINYTSGLALAYNVEWYVEKFRGNKEKSRIALESSMEYMSQDSDIEQYAYYICSYSYAVEKWLIEHDIKSAVILEECADYFYKNGYYRSLVQAIAILEIIFTRMQKGNRIQERCKIILENRLLFDKLPNDIKAISYYFAGVGQILQSNLKNAKDFFTESLMILEKTQDSNLYYNYYYIRNIAHIATIQALTGYWSLASENMKKIENLLQNGNIKNNFDRHSIKQIPHTFNLVKFYIYSRMQVFETSKHKELIDSIYMNLEKLYSYPILLAEFIINADLKNEKLEKLSKSDFENLKRVKHIINYEIMKKKIRSSNKSSELLKSCIQILESSTKDENETYLEKAFTDLLIAKELLALERYDKIYLLLRKYANRLDRLEVLEFRIFMEAFIQVGAYKTGDPLGPALQYMAIKKCRQHGFSRLENKLLDYLSLQGKEALRMIV